MALNANSALVFSQQRGGRTVLRFNGTSANVVVSTTISNTDIADANHANDAILSAPIVGVWWSVTGNTTAVGTITIARQANTIMTLSSTGAWTRNDLWMGGLESPAANVVVTFSAGSAGVVYLEFSKTYAGGDSLIDHP